MIELCQDIYLLVIINITPTTYMSASNSCIKKTDKFTLGGIYLLQFSYISYLLPLEVLPYCLV